MTQIQNVPVRMNLAYAAREKDGAPTDTGASQKNNTTMGALLIIQG
jgi:hypothetical protein